MTERAALSFFLAALLASAGAACSSKDSDEHGEREGEEHGAEANDAEHEGEEEGAVQLSPETAARIRIRVAPVEKRALSGVLNTTGRVDFNQDRLAHVSPRVPGRVHRVRATLGDRVRPGQALAVIDSIELGRARSAFLQAKVRLELARRTLEREQGLLEDRITSEQSVLEARSAEQSALAAYQAARQELRLLGLSSRQIAATSADDPSAALFSLSSPMAGTVVEKHVSLGEVVSPERNLFTVADLSQVWIWIDVYERDLALVHLEDDVEVRVDAFADRTFEGKVAYIRSQVDPDTRTARARIDVVNRDALLRPGMFATVLVTDPHGAGGAQAPQVLVVPSGAVQRDGQEHVAFVVAGENRYQRRELELGRRTDAYVEVIDGLVAGESVVVEGTFLLKSEAAKEQMGGGHSH
jgi:cobalt-zinc-cadmium efflux system membrane fusion protein